MSVVNLKSFQPEAEGGPMEVARQLAGIMVGDSGNRRLLETIVTSLELQSVVLELAEFDPDRLAEFELIIADEEKGTPVEAAN